VFGLVPLVLQQELCKGLPTTTTVYTSVTRSRYSNVVNTANQILGARIQSLCTREEVLRYKGFLFYARAGMDVWTNGGRLLLECTQQLQ
jgi:hypothetical protein